MFDHVSLIYSYLSQQESRLSTYVDGCQVGQTLVNGVPAEAAANAIGFGNEVHPGGTSRGFLGKLKALAVSSFTGSQPASILADPGAPHDPITPANTISVSACDSPQTVVQKAANVVPTADQQAWQRQELTGFIHFGPDTFTDRELGTGTEPVTTFAPTDVDTDQWARTFKQAGRVQRPRGDEVRGYIRQPIARGHDVGAWRSARPSPYSLGFFECSRGLAVV